MSEKRIEKVKVLDGVTFVPDSALGKFGAEVIAAMNGTTNVVGFGPSEWDGFTYTYDTGPEWDWEDVPVGERVPVIDSSGEVVAHFRKRDDGSFRLEP